MSAGSEGARAVASPSAGFAPDARRPGLVRAMGRWTLAALVVNAIIGSGVFGLPAVLARLVGPAAPWAWLLGALGNGVVMLCFAEVASRFTAAGGAYLYARAALPRLVAIQVGWLAYVTRLTAAAAAANLFTVNLTEFLPAVVGAGQRELLRVGLLTVLLGTLAVVNWRGVRQGARLSNLFTVGKLVPLGAFLAAGLLYVATHDPVAAAVPVAAATRADWLQALLLVAFAYGGYDGSMMAMGEAREPRRDAPFALGLAMVGLAALYTAVQVVVDHALADPGSSVRPLADAARVFLGPAGGQFLAAGAVVSVVGLLVANFLAAPRLAFALAEHGDLHPLFGRVHARFHTPHVAILLFGLLVWALAVYGNFEWNATLSAVARLVVYGCTCAALLVLRRREKVGGEAPPWLRLPGGALFPLLGIAFCALLASRLGDQELAILGGVAVIATAHWAIVRR